jgi:hypothetical protein
MQVLDPMQVGQRKGKPFSLLGRNKLIYIDRMNRLLTRVIATTVAKGLPASGKTGEKDVGHASHPQYAPSLRHAPEHVPQERWPNRVDDC